MYQLTLDRPLFIFYGRLPRLKASLFGFCVGLPVVERCLLLVEHAHALIKIGIKIFLPALSIDDVICDHLDLPTQRRDLESELVDFFAQFEQRFGVCFAIDTRAKRLKLAVNALL